MAEACIAARVFASSLGKAGLSWLGKASHLRWSLAPPLPGPRQGSADISCDIKYKQAQPYRCCIIGTILLVQPTILHQMIPQCQCCGMRHLQYFAILSAPMALQCRFRFDPVRQWWERLRRLCWAFPLRSLFTVRFKGKIRTEYN